MQKQIRTLILLISACIVASSCSSVQKHGHVVITGSIGREEWPAVSMALDLDKVKLLNANVRRKAPPVNPSTVMVSYPLGDLIVDTGRVNFCVEATGGIVGGYEIAGKKRQIESICHYIIKQYGIISGCCQSNQMPPAINPFTSTGEYTR
jgi:hypothetical protein